MNAVSSEVQLWKLLLQSVLLPPLKIHAEHTLLSAAINITFQTPIDDIMNPATGGLASANTMQSRVSLSFKAMNVVNKDTFSASDPFLVLFAVDRTKNSKVEVGRTEVVWDNLSPEWVKLIPVTYSFEETQNFTAEIYDCDDAKSGSLTASDFLGYATFTLGSVMGSRGAAKLNVFDKASKMLRTVLTIVGEETKDINDLCHVQFSGVKLENKDGWFGCSDPFFLLSRGNPDGSFTRVWQSEVIMNNLNPKWRLASVPVGLLCNGDHNRPLRIEVYDYDKDGTHDFIGLCDTNLSCILEGVGKAVPLVNPVKQKANKKYQNSGFCKIENIRFERRPSMVEFINGGCEMSLTYAIDYTGSNGAPNLPTSLHYQGNPMQLNQYQQAIASIGNILQEYDSDRMFPTYGYGGFFNNAVNHCFPLTFDPSHVEIPGIDGVLAAYKNSFQYVALSGPTLFAPVLRQTLASVSSAGVNQMNQKYFILLIITDGAINDMNETIDVIVELANYPASVVIVGVGNADFSSMNFLDADGTGLRNSRGQVACRDIVQFVPYNQTVRGIPAGAGAQAALSKATLAEIPGQMLEFFSKKGITPKAKMPPVFRDTASAPAPARAAPVVPTTPAVPAPAAPIPVAATYSPSPIPLVATVYASPAPAPAPVMAAIPVSGGYGQAVYASPAAPAYPQPAYYTR